MEENDEKMRYIITELYKAHLNSSTIIPRRLISFITK